MMKTGAVSDPRSRLMWDIFHSSQETEAVDAASLKTSPEKANGKNHG